MWRIRQPIPHDQSNIHRRYGPLLHGAVYFLDAGNELLKVHFLSSYLVNAIVPL